MDIVFDAVSTVIDLVSHVDNKISNTIASDSVTIESITHVSTIVNLTSDADDRVINTMVDVIVSVCNVTDTIYYVFLSNSCVFETNSCVIDTD